LQTEFRRNVEVMWLLGRLYSDHKSIAEFKYLTAVKSLPRPALATRKVSLPLTCSNSPAKRANGIGFVLAAHTGIIRDYDKRLKVRRLVS
jgi:hypothetical protein